MILELQIGRKGTSLELLSEMNKIKRRPSPEPEILHDRKRRASGDHKRQASLESYLSPTSEPTSEMTKYAEALTRAEFLMDLKLVNLQILYFYLVFVLSSLATELSCKLQRNSELHLYSALMLTPAR